MPRVVLASMANPSRHIVGYWLAGPDLSICPDNQSVWMNVQSVVTENQSAYGWVAYV
jgi:hypothetical protein